MTEYIVKWKTAHMAIVDASNEDKAKQIAVLACNTVVGIVDGVVSVSKYDEKLEAQLEWIRTVRGDEP